MKVFLAPGASGGASSLQPYVAGLAARGIEARPVQLPGGNAERAVPVYLDQSGYGPDVVVGGRSYGGRVASLAAADSLRRFAGLLLFAYPLHRPGFPQQLRTEHWPLIRCPVLIVQGESDPFGSPAELRREAGKLREVRVVTLPGTGHTLKGGLDEALAAAADWIEGLR
ncbi:MAG TPA: alpha/beta family hydrolase [Terriglobales bacterium]|nr:alpha/beta family hydrolase [Terriglobales bacterium]